MRSAIWMMCVTSLVATIPTGAWAEDPYQVAWKAQIGSTAYDHSYSLALDASGNAYLTGVTHGDFGGSNAGSDDAFLSKLDSGGNELWTIQIGTSGIDRSSSVAVDAWGNAYISGWTEGDLCGSGIGASDAFLAKFDSGGSEIWSTQIGTTNKDYSYSMALDASGGAYVSGYTLGDLGGPNAGSIDAFLIRFDSGGNEVWRNQFGSSRGDWGRSVAVDAWGNVYNAGYTDGDLGGSNVGSHDVFLSKFDSDGSEHWTTQIGTRAHDRSLSVAVDALGNAYITGHTEGDLGASNKGDRDVFLSKFDSDGNEIWTTQIGTSQYEDSLSIALDTSGNAYITGTTYGDLGGPIAGRTDAFLSKFDSDGKEIWTIQTGTNVTDGGHSVAVDASGNLYFTGFTYGDLGGPNAGDRDAFLVKYEVPEPTTMSLLALGGLAMLKRRRILPHSRS